MPLKYQQQFKILYTTKRLPTVVPQRAFEGDLLFMRSFMSITPVGKILPPNLIFGAAYRLMSVSKQHMTHIAQNSFLICLGILFAILFYLIWGFETSILLIIGDWWLLIY